MSAYIGNVRGPDHNSPETAADVWCSPGRVELRVLEDGLAIIAKSSTTTFDPIAARNLAALLVRASEEAERMQERKRE